MVDSSHSPPSPIHHLRASRSSLQRFYSRPASQARLSAVDRCRYALEASIDRICRICCCTSPRPTASHAILIPGDHTHATARANSITGHRFEPDMIIIGPPCVLMKTARIVEIFHHRRTGTLHSGAAISCPGDMTPSR